MPFTRRDLLDKSLALGAVTLVSAFDSSSLLGDLAARINSLAFTHIRRLLILLLTLETLSPWLNAQERPVAFVDVTVDSALRAQSNDEANDSDVKACAALAGDGKPPWSVNSAEFVNPPLTVFVTVGPRDSWRKVTVAVPFCRVIGTIKPTPASNIRFELWLPPRTDWNGKFEGVGSGGSLGTIQYPGLMRALVRGYATVATDNGHQSESAFDENWALGQPERVIDFGYRAEHTVTQAAKTLTERFYGRAPQHSYFVGCSQGGHHGLMEAQRFPEDYDGIVAGAPAYSWTGEMAGQAWNVRALQQTTTGALPPQILQLLQQSVTKACGGADGLIDNARQCSFDPAALRCSRPGENSCLTDSEIEAVRRMYGGPTTSPGLQIYPGLSPGGETRWERLWSDPKKLGGSWESFYRFMVFQNPAWELSTMDFDRDPSLAKQKLGNILDPDNPDLARFADHGGKIIVYHGWADDMVPSQVSTEYYASVTAKLGPQRVSSFYRLLMVPGMAHCGGGPGANVLFHSEEAAAVPLKPDRDMLTALEQWVEHGRVPSSFVASRLDKDGAIERTRLVCAYPSIAKYRGAGDVNRAENWECPTK
jgi:feruloyl esterase